MARRIKTMAQPWHGEGRYWVKERSSIINIITECRRQAA